MPLIENILTEIFDLQKFAIKLGLENISKLSAHFHNPHLSYPTIHIAGTNGKGSTSIILQKILMQHGFKVGLFTSPHLFRFQERIRVNDDLIENQFIDDFWSDIKSKVLNLKATFFDTTTCMAFEYFKQQNVDIAIFETGLGGRLDSTNIVQPQVAAITPIGFDHHKQLGNTLTQIASEKAGIIKNDHAVYLAKQKSEVQKYFTINFKKNIYFFEDVIDTLKVETWLHSTVFSFKDNLRKRHFSDTPLNLLGLHQAENACLAYAVACDYLENVALNFDLALFQSALKQVVWPGRIELISEKPNIYLDVSHNVSGFESTLQFIQSHFHKNKCHLLIGLLDDKDYKQIVNLTKNVFSNFWIAEPENARKLAAPILKSEYKKHGISAYFIKDTEDLYESVINKINPDEVLFIMGSHFLASMILSMKLQKT